MNDSDLQDDKFKPGNFKPVQLVLIIFLIMIFISQAIKWYSQSVTLPRFCKDTELSLHHLQEVITRSTPAENNYTSRKPYIIAAKLIYLVPQQANEPVADYINRVRKVLNRKCRL